MTDLNKIHYDKDKQRHYILKHGEDGTLFKVWMD